MLKMKQKATLLLMVAVLAVGIFPAAVSADETETPTPDFNIAWSTDKAVMAPGDEITLYLEINFPEGSTDALECLSVNLDSSARECLALVGKVNDYRQTFEKEGADPKESAPASVSMSNIKKPFYFETTSIAARPSMMDFTWITTRTSFKAAVGKWKLSEEFAGDSITLSGVTVNPFAYRWRTAMATYADDQYAYLTAANEFSITVDVAEGMLGDIDGNKEINMLDATALTRFASGWTPEEGTIWDTSAADLNGDGEVNMKDATLLTRFAAGWYPEKTLEEMKAEWQETA